MELVETTLGAMIVLMKWFFKASRGQNTPNSTRASSQSPEWSHQEIDYHTKKPIGPVQLYARDEEVVLEQAFRQQPSMVELGNATISFSEGLHISDDSSIHRVNRSAIKKGKLRQRHKHLAFYNRQIAVEDPIIVDCLAPSIDDSAANIIGGILKEGVLQNLESQARQLVQKLQATDENNNVLIGLAVIKLYTNASFLPESLDKFLRERDYSKVNTLGPFCKLLYAQFNKYQSNVDSLKVYRGDYLCSRDIRAYKRGIGKKSYRWLGFTSTSTSEEVAQKFIQNAYFIIGLEKIYNDGRALYIGKLSNFPDEDEVLLRPGVEFSINKFEYNEETKINTFYLTVYI